MPSSTGRRSARPRFRCSRLDLPGEPMCQPQHASRCGVWHPRVLCTHTEYVRESLQLALQWCDIAGHIGSKAGAGLGGVLDGRTQQSHHLADALVPHVLKAVPLSRDILPETSKKPQQRASEWDPTRGAMHAYPQLLPQQNIPSWHASQTRASRALPPAPCSRSPPPHGGTPQSFGGGQHAGAVVPRV